MHLRHVKYPVSNHYRNMLLLYCVLLMWFSYLPFLLTCCCISNKPILWPRRWRLEFEWQKRPAHNFAHRKIPAFAEDFVPRDQTRQDRLFGRDEKLTVQLLYPSLLPCSANSQHTAHEVLSLLRFHHHHTWRSVWDCRGVIAGALISNA
jgi:hypothetical protein